MIQTLEHARVLRWQREILAMARMLALEEAAVMDWYQGDGIAALGHQTAAQLVARGRGAQVVAFLLGIARLEQAHAMASAACVWSLDAEPVSAKSHAFAAPYTSQ